MHYFIFIHQVDIALASVSEKCMSIYLFALSGELGAEIWDLLRCDLDVTLKGLGFSLSLGDLSGL